MTGKKESLRGFDREYLVRQEARIRRRLEHCRDVLVHDSTTEEARLKAQYVIPASLLALQQIEAGRYGICVECEEDISVQRLEIMPAAIRCLDCQKKVE